MWVSGFLLPAGCRQTGRMCLPGGGQTNKTTAQRVETEREREARSVGTERSIQTVQKKVGLTQLAAATLTLTQTHMNIDRATTPHTHIRTFAHSHIFDMNDIGTDGRSIRYEKSDRGFCLTLAFTSPLTKRHDTTRQATSSRHSLAHALHSVERASSFPMDGPIGWIRTEKEGNHTYVTCWD